MVFLLFCDVRCHIPSRCWFVSQSDGIARLFVCLFGEYYFILFFSPGLNNFVHFQQTFSFFYWRYKPLWVLAFSVIFFHSALSSHCFLHRLTPIICKSSSMACNPSLPWSPSSSRTYRFPL